MLAGYDEEAWATVEVGAEAEARGDAARALELHLAGPHVPGSLREHVLREMIWLGTEAPSWVVARWIVKQVFRCLLLGDDARLTEAIQMTVGAMYADVDLDHPLGWRPDEFVNHLVTSDWVCAQLATYELGGLDAFLSGRVCPELLGRAAGVGDWGQGVMSGYRLVGLENDLMEAIDLLTGRPLALLNIGAAWCRDPDTCVIGRVVPIDSAPGLMFESRPLTVDDVTAHQVARAAALGRTTWVGVLGEARAAGRLPEGFSLCLPTSLVCDVPGGPPMGLSDADDPAVALCDFVLDQVADDVDCAAFVAPTLLGVLLDPTSFAAIRERCTTSARQQAWSAIAAACYSPFRDRCEELAGGCGWRPAA